ncbi:hypothetical protein [Mammaliicoccus sciuri]|uniref:hypothetical protein n=1 Tax=Mammaliicoccus sciuri TaxID=1296 RepID=UPI002B25B831|nr:hypothetical protein [Mammaliicoccus sciuri]WQL61713.1 hypothetical protein P3T96_15145 [Mammaliicoccus sciuri]
MKYNEQGYGCIEENINNHFVINLVDLEKNNLSTMTIENGLEEFSLSEREQQEMFLYYYLLEKWS